LDAAGRVDFAILVVTARDTLSTRSKVLQVGRDNVLFEFGLFLGALGSERAFLLVDRASPAVLPTDLGGITPLDFDSRKTNSQSAVGAACTTIQSRMAVLGLRGAGRV
jgi:predicted nucleotide-binding protein